MHDVVLLGGHRLPRRWWRSRTRVTVQAYEDTGGLAPGDAGGTPPGAPSRPDWALACSAAVFDGLLRPLSRAGDWLLPGAGP